MADTYPSSKDNKNISRNHSNTQGYNKKYNKNKGYNKNKSYDNSDSSDSDQKSTVSPKLVAPKVETSKGEATKGEATKVEAPKVETSKVEATKGEATKVEAPKVETSKVEATKVDLVKGDSNTSHAKIKKLREERDELLQTVQDYENEMYNIKKNLMANVTAQQAIEAVLCSCCDTPVVAYSQITPTSSELVGLEFFFAQSAIQRTILDCKHTICYPCAVQLPDLRICPRCRAHVNGVERSEKNRTLLHKSLEKYKIQCPFEGCKKFTVTSNDVATNKLAKSSYIDVALHYSRDHLSIPAFISQVPEISGEYLAVKH